MRVKTIVDEDFVNYKKPSLFIGTASCRGKCCLEAGLPLSACQNDGWRREPSVIISDAALCHRYLSNPITSAIVLGGLEPFEQFDEVLRFLRALRLGFGCEDDVVLYTGYTPGEVAAALLELRKLRNIIVKFGRFRPGEPPHFDPVLGVSLASANQYAEKIS